MVSTRFEYEIKLNNEPLKATLGATVVRKLQEPLDEGALHIPITVFDYEYEMFGNLYIKITDIKTTQSKEFTYLIAKDTVKVLSTEGIYSHDLKVIEYSYAYTTKLIERLNFTRRIKNNRKAPFFTHATQTVASNGIAIEPSYYIAPLELDQYYETNTQYTLNQVAKGYLIDIYGNTRPHVVIRIYNPNNIELIDDRYYVSNGVYEQETILSDEPCEFQFDLEGVWVIEYGMKHAIDNTYFRIRSYSTIVVSNEKNTLYDYIQRIRSVVPLETKQYHEETRLFDIDSNLVERFKKIQMPQLYFSRQTLKQTLDIMFKYINAISRVEYLTNNLDKLTIDEFNKVVGSFNLGNLTGFETSQDIQGYATKMVSFLENSLQENFRDNPSVKNPNGMLKTVRAKTVQLINAQNGFILPLNDRSLYFPTKIEITLPKVNYGSFSGISPQPLIEETLFTLDITSRFLPLSEWELKTITNVFPTYQTIPMCSQDVGLRENKSANFFWESGKTYIDFSKEIGTWFSETILMTTLKEAMNEYFTINQPLVLNTDGTLFSNGINVGYEIENIEESWFYRNISFNIEYVTLESPMVKTNRADTSVINKNTELRLNQTQRIVDFSLAIKNAYGNIQRSGMPNLQFSKIHTRLDTMLEVGLRDVNGYVITQAVYELYNDHIVGFYEATKNHNRLSEFMGIDQTYRVFEVPKNGDVYERHDNYEDFMIIDRPLANNFTEENTLYNGLFIDKAFKGIYASDLTEEKITFAFVRTDGFLKAYPDLASVFNAVMSPVSSFGGDQVLVFTFGFKNNLVAGNAIYKKGVNYFNKAILYTDHIGRFDELWFGLASQFSPTTPFPNIGDFDETIFNDSYAQPLFKSNTNDLKQTFLVKTGNIQDSTYNPIIYMKDISESMASFNYQVSIMPYDYRDYVIGTKFFTANRLVYNPSSIEKLYLYRYRDNTRYEIFDNLLIKDDTFTHIYDKVELVRTSGYTNLNFNTTTKQLTFINEATIDPNIHTSWAIGDEDGNLIIACNVNVNGFIVKRRHFRPNITQIGEFGTNIKMGVSIVISSTIQAVGSVPTLYLGTATLPITSVMSSSGYASTDYVGSANLSIESSYGTANELSTDVTGRGVLSIVASLTAVGEVDINFNGTASLNIVATLAPTAIVSTNYYGGVSLSIVSSMSTSVGEAQYFEWVLGGSSATLSQECNSVDDVGNVRAVLASCSFTTTNSYTSTTNETTAFTCGVHTTRTVCTFNKTLGIYFCEEQDVTENYTYETCTLV